MSLIAMSLRGHSIFAPYISRTLTTTNYNFTSSYLYGLGISAYQISQNPSFDQFCLIPRVASSAESAVTENNYITALLPHNVIHLFFLSFLFLFICYFLLSIFFPHSFPTGRSFVCRITNNYKARMN